MAAAGRVVCAAAALLLLMSTANAENNATAETDELMKRLEGSKLIGGILGIQKSGRLVYERAFGNAVVVSTLIFGLVLEIIGKCVMVRMSMCDICKS